LRSFVVRLVVLLSIDILERQEPYDNRKDGRL
jgi:hypothetical protein